MCVALPGRVTWVDGGKVRVEIRGQEQDVIAVDLPDLRRGDFVLVSLGMALERIEEEEALLLSSMWRQVGAAMQSE